MSVITCQTLVHSKVPRRMQSYLKVPIQIRKRKRRTFLPRHIVLYNGTDNPNNEQKLMVDTFIKSSNGLFKREMEVLDDKAAGSEESFGACPSKFGLFKAHMENSAKIDMDLSQDKVVHTGRMKRYLFLDNIRTIRPLDQVRDGHGAWRCGRDRDSLRIRLPKERISHSRQSDLKGGIYTNGLHMLPRFKRRLPSNKGQHVTHNRRYLSNKFYRLNNSFKGNDSGEVEDLKKSKEMFTLFDQDSYLKNLQSLAKQERMKSLKKLLRKRSNACANPLQRSRCKNHKPTVVIHSVNIGRTGKICFPSTHRCMKIRTCPCSVEYRKCPPRTTCCLVRETLCFEDTESTTGTTIGRCQGIDTLTPTPLDEGFCLVTPCLEQPNKHRKRCACDCGCGCPHSLRRNHPDRALARGRCGCGCGCGCLHGGVHNCRTRKPLT